MKPLIQKLPVTEQSSFVAKTYTTPFFETTWHQHKEVELILQLKGQGMCFIGNYVGYFKVGDVFLLGANLPHEFKKEHPDMECSVMVIHFDLDLWKGFWSLPECKEIIHLLQEAKLAFKLNDPHPEITETIKRLEFVSGFERITLLCQCLFLISRHRNKRTLSTLLTKELNVFTDDRINKVLEYTIGGFTNKITLSEVAFIANLSVSAFCRYFKKTTKKTYIEFVHEMRISYACQALMDTDKTILQICYECGFNTIANFNKQFLKVKGIKPSQFKTNFRK